MHVLISGAGGMIGSRVAEAAREAGYTVTQVFHRTPPRETVDALQRDLRLPLEDVPTPDAIFHLAGGYVGSSQQGLEKADLAMARNIIQWGVAHRVKRWVFASAAEVYGRVNGCATEETPPAPVIPYGRVKLAVEGLLTQMAKDLPECRVAILRIGEVYGAESRLLRELAARLRQGFCPLVGSGRVPVSFVHVDDAAQAFICAAERAPAGASVYNVADDEPATWRTFVERFAELLDARPPFSLPRSFAYAYMLGSQLRSRMAGLEPLLTSNVLRLLTTPKVLSNQKIKRELGFALLYPDFRQGLEAAVHGLSDYAKNGATQRSAPHKAA